MKGKLERKYFKKVVYKKVSFFADDNNYFLLNNVKLVLDPTLGEPSFFNHIIIC